MLEHRRQVAAIGGYVRFVFRDLAGARTVLEEGAPYADGAVATYNQVYFHQLRALSILGVTRPGAPEAAHALEEVAPNVAQVRTWQRFLPEIAIGNEIAFRHHEAKGDATAAGSYFDAASRRAADGRGAPRRQAVSFVDHARRPHDERMRHRVLGVLAAVVLSTPLLATTACRLGCWDPDPECGRRGGYIDQSTCSCVGEHYSYPPYTPPPACQSDASCTAPLHCMADGSCSNLCVSNADCRRGATCSADGYCARACKVDADCSAGFTCNSGACAWDSPRCRSFDGTTTCPSDMKCESEYGIECGAVCGSEQCRPRFECNTPAGGSPRCEARDYRRCVSDSECNTELGGECVEDQCFGPRVRVADAAAADGDAGDAGEPDSGSDAAAL